MIKITISQMNVIPGNPRQNKETMLRDIAAAINEKSDLIIFPELCLSGYLIGDLWDQPAFINECIRFGDEIIALSDNITIIFGNVAIDSSKWNEDGHCRRYNAMYIAQQGKLIAPIHSPYPYYIKTLLPNYRLFTEPRYFTSLRTVAEENHKQWEDYLSPVYLMFSGKRNITVGPLICEDSWDTSYTIKPIAWLSQQFNIDLFINISASPFTLGKKVKRHILFKKNVHEAHTPLLYVNCAGIQNNGKNIYTFDGSSCVYSDKGAIEYELQSYNAETVSFSFDPQTKKFITPKALPDMESETASICETLQQGLKQFLQQIGVKKIVIGVSGGIDSAVNAALYATILPPENILLVNMPSRYNSGLTKDLAKTLADNLGCPYTTLPIQDSITLTTEQINKATLTIHGKIVGKLSLTPFMEENIQARDRSSRILAAISAAFGGVFTCNANKAEASVGYATLYGDNAGFLAATGDLWKYQVYALATYLNEVVFERPVIPQGSIDIVPCAELSINHKVEEGKGDPLIYPYHDYLFAAFIQQWNRVTPEEILHWYDEGTLEKNIGCSVTVKDIFPTATDFITDLEKWWNLITGFAIAKRIQSPPQLSISRRSYGYDLRESQLTPYYTTPYLKLKSKLLEEDIHD